MSFKISRNNEVAVTISGGSTDVTNVDVEAAEGNGNEVVLGTNNPGAHAGLRLWLEECSESVSRGLQNQLKNKVLQAMKEQAREPAKDGAGAAETSGPREDANVLSTMSVKKTSVSSGLPEGNASDADFKASAASIKDAWTIVCKESVGGSHY